MHAGFSRLSWHGIFSSSSFLALWVSAYGSLLATSAGFGYISHERQKYKLRGCNGFWTKPIAFSKFGDMLLIWGLNWLRFIILLECLVIYALRVLHTLKSRKLWQSLRYLKDTKGRRVRSDQIRKKNSIHTQQHIYTITNPPPIPSHPSTFSTIPVRN